VTDRPAAVILAAGRGARIGQPKHRLQAEGGTFLDKVLVLTREAGCGIVVCVAAGDEADEVRRVSGPTVRVAVNPDPARGMLSSLQEALPLLDAVPGTFVFPVDHPYVAPATARLLMESVLGQLDAVVKPEFQGRGGHPVYIPAALFTPILHAQRDDSLRTVIAASRIRVVRIVVTDEGVVRNVNTPGDIF
jgi:molybdenum cofactor cytidylyltransferase